MTFITHTLLTSLGVQIFSIQGNNALLAYLFGVGIDLDHLVKIPLYIEKYGLKRKRHYNWRTFIQEPISILWIIPLCLFISSFIPIIFFSGHVLLDYLVSYIKTPFFPFSDYKTHGLLSKVDNPTIDILIEIVLALFLLCLNLILKLTTK